jgi:hypothetical protein
MNIDRAKYILQSELAFPGRLPKDEVDMAWSVISRPPGFLRIDGDADNRDLVLMDNKSFWVTAGGISIYIQPNRDGKGVKVDLFAPGKACEEPIDWCEAGGVA